MGRDIRARRYDDPEVQRLVVEMAEDLARFYGPGTYPPQDPDDWAPPRGAVVVAYDDGEAVACGGLIRHTGDSAELKRMFVRPSHRRRGLARSLLAALEAEAGRLGYERVVLETGAAQQAAQELYRTCGYSRVACWAPHDADPTSVCFAKRLGAGGDAQPR
ncbi:MAG TPA: GNAT family N-acetyltransferase [Acidimicrobiales bacterium]|nr:GNAT family N-acetyltransferase [Acidimicrobiales bacterium]